MSDWLLEHQIHCPFCAESLSVLLDLSAGDQDYIEDCQVCCQPIAISFQTEDDQLISLQVNCGS